MADEERAQLLGRLDGRAGLLELEPRAPVRQLQLPQALAVLNAVTQGDPAAGEPVVGRVVIGGDEEPRLDRLTAELRQPERVARAQLHLALDGLLDRHASSLGRWVVNRR